MSARRWLHTADISSTLPLDRDAFCERIFRKRHPVQRGCALEQADAQTTYRHDTSLRTAWLRKVVARYEDDESIER